MIEIKDIKKLAELSRIEMEEAEIEEFQKEIESILSYVGQIQEASAGSFSDKKEIPVLHNVFREDEKPHESGAYTEILLDEAPEREGSYLKVKKIL
ncbi:MAG: Asp-tRNA(Asn)/Glu-tRNA(Gln) amidotransferase subunit GatC [Parcubacteria group bacterium]|nr:Asp-tRNA(Asn)/Glu-tRNA(Gln) amidotransferase subunit GatC [Parcubacteria group bacterium]